MTPLRAGMKVAVGLTVGLGLLAMSASVFLAREEYRDVTTPATHLESAGLIEAPFVFGAALLIASVGLLAAQNWARIQVVMSALLFSVALGLLAVLAFTFAEQVTTSLTVPVLALPGGLACLWLAYYLSIGGGRSHFPSFTSPSSRRGCARAAALVVAAPLMVVAIALATMTWNVASDMRHPPPPSLPPPTTEQITADFKRVLLKVPAAEHVEARSCPDAEIEKASPARERIHSYFGDVAFIRPILYQTTGEVWSPPQGWEWLTDSAIRRLPAAHDYDLGPLGTLRYLAVLRSSEKSLPEPLAPGTSRIGGRRMIAGTHFRPGTFRGGLFVMDIQRAAVVCQAPLDVTSSAFVDYRPDGPLAAAPQDAVTQDFQKQLVERSRAAMRQISQSARVSLVMRAP
jgi:hypothetical protein